MEEVKIPKPKFAPIEETENKLSNIIGITKRKRMVKTQFYSIGAEFFHMFANRNIVAKFDAEMSGCEDNNWANLYRVGSDGKFVHEDMMMEFLKFWFGNDDCVRSMGRINGVDARTTAKIIAWRNKVMNGWKVLPENSTKNEVGIYFCPKKAHARIAKLFEMHPYFFGHITTCIVNGDHTTNRKCKCHIKHNLALWKFGNHSNGKGYIEGESKFIILMDGMGNRSLSIKEVTWCIVTGNSISYASFDQKTARVRTEWKDDKEAFVLDMTLNKEGYSFNAETLINHYAQRKGRTIASVIDEFTQYKTFFKIACALDGDCESVFSKSDYYDYVRHLSTIVREGRFVNANLFVENILNAAKLVIADKKFKKVSNDVEFVVETNSTPGTDKIPNEEKPSNAGNGGTKQDKTPMDRQLVANVFHNIVSHPRTLMNPVEGEDKDFPLVARWESVRDGFIESYSYKYGTHVGKLLDAIMEFVTKDDVWNKLIVNTSNDYMESVDLASLMFS